MPYFGVLVCLVVAGTNVVSVLMVSNEVIGLGEDDNGDSVPVCFVDFFGVNPFVGSGANWLPSCFGFDFVVFVLANGSAVVGDKLDATFLTVVLVFCG